MPVHPTEQQSRSMGAAEPSVTWLCAGTEGYGVRRMALNLMGAVRSRLGWITRAICVSDGPLAAELRAEGVTVTILDLPPTPPLSGNPVRAVMAMRRSSRRIVDAVRAAGVSSPTALVVQWPNLVHAGGAVARALDCRVVWEMPNSISRRMFGLNRAVYQLICLRYGVQPLAISESTAASLGGWPVRPWVFYLGADESTFDASIVEPIDRASLGIPADAVVLCIVARVVPSKGQMVVVRALADVEPNVHLVIVGGPEESDHVTELRRTAQETGLADRVHFAGLVPDPQRYYAMADIVINSRVDVEPFGLTVVEAMMMGKLLLVHAFGGPAETVRDGVTGWHVHAPEPAAFAAAIRRACADRPRWPEMQAASRERALTHFSLAAQTERFRQAIDAVVAGRRQPPPALRGASEWA